MVNALQAVPMNRVATTDMLGRWDSVRITTQDIDEVRQACSPMSHPTKRRVRPPRHCEQKIERFDTALFAKRAAVCPHQGDFARAAPRQSRCAGIFSTHSRIPALRCQPDKRARMSAILKRLEEIRQEFGRNIRNNKTRLTFTADEVKGLPQSYLDRAQRDEKGNFLLGFEYPEYLPFMANAENEDARRRYQFAYSTRGTPRNIELLSEVVTPAARDGGTLRAVELRAIRDAGGEWSAIRRRWRSFSARSRARSATSSARSWRS